MERGGARKRVTRLPSPAVLGFALTAGVAAPSLSHGGDDASAACARPFPRVECLTPTAAPRAATRQRTVKPASQPARFGKEVPGATGEERPAPQNPTPQDAAPQDDALPLSREQLFGPGGAAGAGAQTPQSLESEPAGSRDELFGVAPTAATERKPLGLRGFVQFEPAYTYASPGHWSRGVVRTQGEVQGQLNARTKWKASLRLDVDPVYWGSDFYPDAVKDDQRFDLLVRETYADLSLPRDWELRLGRQHVVWGEVVGLFFADVVSARDVRDFILPDFEILRIPQWAARAEYFGRDTHFELVWIPFQSYDDIGKPGAEFYPFRLPDTPGFNQVLLDDNRPGNSLDNSGYGARVSRLAAGWDLSAFYYRSTSAAPTLYRDVQLAPTPTVVFEPRHDRIWQAGGTLGKDFRRFVLKAEAVYTEGRRFEVTDLARPGGVAEQDTLDYMIGLDFLLPKEGRLNLQAFQRVFFDHDPALVWDEVESGVSLLISAKPLPKIEPQFLIIQSLNSNDRMLRPRLTWHARPNLRATFGVDIFAGPALGFFGRFGDSDRVYSELRYTF